MTSLVDAMAAAPLLLDGGLATQLEAQGADLSGSLWSARLLRDEPDQIVAAHLAFLAAGARIIETATYQATFEGWAAAGLDTGEAVALMHKGSDLARQAVAEFREAGNDDDIFIAAAVGPYGAMLADGSEYTGSYALSVAELRHFHRRRLVVLAESGVDVIALETVPNAAEVTALVEATDDLPVPVWISVSITGERIRAGERLDEVFATAASGRNVVAIGVNCSTPADATAAVPVAASFGKPVVVYPNSGEGWNADTRSWNGVSAFDADTVADWVATGARIVGGCCRVTPADISELARNLKTAKT